MQVEIKTIDLLAILQKSLSSIVFIQGAFHVKPTLKVRQALSFHTPAIFKEREAAEESEYSKSDDLKKLSVLYWPKFLISYKRNMCILKRNC